MAKSEPPALDSSTTHVALTHSFISAIVAPDVPSVKISANIRTPY